MNGLKLRLHKTRRIYQNKNWNFVDMRLKISLISYLRMCYYTNSAEGEISGLGKIKIIDDENAIVSKVLIFEQECSGAGTELNYNGAIDRFMIELIRKNEDPQHWKLWWHSHNDFSVGWSCIDEENIAKFSKDAVLFSICINKMGDMIGRIDEKSNTSELSLSVLPAGYVNLRENCKREVLRKVKALEPEVITVTENQENAIIITKEMEEKYGLHPTIIYD